MIKKVCKMMLVVTLIAVSITGCRKEKDSVNTADNQEGSESEKEDYSFIDSTGSTLVTRIKAPEGYSRIACENNIHFELVNTHLMKVV
jgi:predicted small lipoprotein YifL